MRRTNPYDFSRRHIGLYVEDEREMLKVLGLPSMSAMIAQIVPSNIRFDGTLDLPEPATESEALREIRALMDQNKVARSFIGQGYYGCYIPEVIKRNLFENPAWYTAYTPYQPEISQGRLEMLFHFQTLVSELAGLPVANASLLDEATSVAEAIGMAFRHHRQKRHHVSLAGNLHPQTRDVVDTRARPLGLTVSNARPDENTAAFVIAWPDTTGQFTDCMDLIDSAKEYGALVIAVTDPLSLVLLQAPGDWGADIVVGSMQRFGIPMGFGGPHAAYIATTSELTRLLPGRLVGKSVDAQGREAYRLSLQTREQHIRREKATSNICTAQALLANMAAAYAIWHGPLRLKAIAERVHGFAASLQKSLLEAEFDVATGPLFDTVAVTCPGQAAQLHARALETGRLVRVIGEDIVCISFDETSEDDDLEAFCRIFGVEHAGDVPAALPGTLRPDPFLTQPVFNQYRSETELMRFLRLLSDKDLALDRAMIPLGSCTMKLNAAAEMAPVSWEQTCGLHPFAPSEHWRGYAQLIGNLESWLAEITGFDAISLQPNAGSQGEYAGLLAIRRYFDSIGQQKRDLCLIPESAHGTNPASAHMAGFEIAIVKCTGNGDIDVEDLRQKAVGESNRLAALMITYPSTHGVFEERIREICQIVHDNGGQVYLDGANMNAMVGLVRPGDIGADVCHLNLHKTFCIPHGGGGPGVGPIGVKGHLAAFLPGHSQLGTSHAVASAPYGSASILPITWMYIRMMGAKGLRHATETAILSANYVAKSLSGKFPVLFAGKNGFVAHECIIDTRVFRENADISVEDIAKRLIDYGFHAPTMSWPVAGTLMVEPTESEPRTELDRFCEAMLRIASEAERIAAGKLPRDDNPLKNAPHTAHDLMQDDWSHPYSRLEAAYPDGTERLNGKFWPPVSRIDNVYGDRNLVCTCPPVKALAS